MTNNEKLIEEKKIQMLEIDKQIEKLNSKKDEIKSAINNLELIKDLNEYQFRCSNCMKIHTESAYCVAQRASGHSIVHTCDCGNKTTLEAYEKKKW